MSYALIVDGLVSNIVWMHPREARKMENAVPVRDLPVRIGDSYADGSFFRNGERVLSPMEAAQAENEDMRNALTQLEVRMNG